MGKRGPKKTPAPITQLRGNPGRRSADERSVKVPEGSVEIPRWLTELRPPDGYEAKTLAELRPIAAALKVPRISRLAKSALIDAIREHQEDERRTEWSWIVPTLQRMGLATPIDAPALAMLVDQYVLYTEERRKVARVGATYETTNKFGDVFIRARPENSLADRALARTKAFMALYGMTASDRTGKGDEDADPLEELRRGARDAG
jgi:hypothetical protein